jgi:ribosomal protein S3
VETITVVLIKEHVIRAAITKAITIRVTFNRAVTKMLTPIMKIGIHHIYIKDTGTGKMAALNTVLSI